MKRLGTHDAQYKTLFYMITPAGPRMFTALAAKVTVMVSAYLHSLGPVDVPGVKGTGQQAGVVQQKSIKGIKAMLHLCQRLPNEGSLQLLLLSGGVIHL